MTDLCPICQNPLEGKQKYCSATCRKKASRTKPDQGETVQEVSGDDRPKALAPSSSPLPGSLTPTPIFPTPAKKNRVEATPLTDSDRTFLAWLPGYYRFDVDTLTKQCNTCGKQFKSHLNMTRFCSPDCRDYLLKRLTGVRDAPIRK